jgi:hypothetical protein
VLLGGEHFDDASRPAGQRGNVALFDMHLVDSPEMLTV